MPRRSEQSSFYKSKVWKDCRKNYFKAHTLCEECLKQGIIEPGVIVHHRIHISPDNLMDHSVLTNWDNLQTLCRKCHAAAHPEMYREHRYTIHPDGSIAPRGE